MKKEKKGGVIFLSVCVIAAVLCFVFAIVAGINESNSDYDASYPTQVSASIGSTVHVKIENNSYGSSNLGLVTFTANSSGQYRVQIDLSNTVSYLRAGLSEQSGVQTCPEKDSSQSDYLYFTVTLRGNTTYVLYLAASETCNAYVKISKY